MKTINALGTLRYMAPEVFTLRSYKMSSDIYSYAITLWEMITRTRPYALMDDMQIMYGVGNNQLRPKIDGDNIPKNMRPLIERLE
jgi:serine/threonine protein kinase